MLICNKREIIGNHEMCTVHNSIFYILYIYKKKIMIKPALNILFLFLSKEI